MCGGTLLVNRGQPPPTAKTRSPPEANATWVYQLSEGGRSTSGFPSATSHSATELSGGRDPEPESGPSSGTRLRTATFLPSGANATERTAPPNPSNGTLGRQPLPVCSQMRAV